MIRRVSRASRLGRSPVNLLVVLGAITIGSAASLTWLGWKLLDQDASLEATRAQERLERDADRVVQAIERRLAEVDVRLSEWLEPSPSGPAKPVEFGTAVLLTPTAAQPVPPARLLFHPVLPEFREPPASIFEDAERLENQLGNYAQAAETYRGLARSPDPATRAAALMRLGRAERSAGRGEAALEAYLDLQKLVDVRIISLPADLVGRVESARVLQQLGRGNESRESALSIARDLASGRWQLARGQYEQYQEDVGKLAGLPPPAATEVALSTAVSELWHRWRAQQTSRGPQVLRQSGVPLLVVFRGAADRAAVWLVLPSELLERLGLESELAITLTDTEGVIAATSTSTGSFRALRAAGVDTPLPWTMKVTRTGAPVRDSGTQRTLVISGLVLMLVFLGAGAFFIGRAIRHETELARLQSDFVSAVSHEFRTPLASMRQFSELLADGRVPNDEKRQHYYESLAGESRRLQRLVENLLNFSRLEAGAKPYQAEPIDLAALVHDVVAEFRSQLSRPECEIEVKGSADAAPLVADRQAIALALHNLLDNAVKYSGGNQPVRIDWARQGDRIALSVRDHGPGISPREQEQIFQRFFRGEAAASAKVRGTGIGLAMVKLVVASHGGDVTVESEPGAGSTFTMLLPIAETT